MILPAQEIRRIRPVEPFHERTVFNGMSYGLSHAGYDVRIAEDLHLGRGDFALASTLEKFNIPDDVIALVHDKSSLARRGISLFNTVIEPGWRGWLTLEIVNHSNYIHIKSGTPIAQIIFMKLMEKTESPYQGKYQDQPRGAVPAKNEY